MSINTTNDDTTLATELLKDVKVQGKRWFIAAMVELGIIVGIVAGFLWYISLPIEETTTTQTVETMEDGNITQIGGDSYGESSTND